eukprot:TRINITY_DN24304_c1_g1_i1.p1 TRINITY_DN24304_c1_g1~~TRINITY_DN24304_c1_g1_i1.p1  ORF type:complete len:120 (-),score=4.96 TRINITY_DN24304_c1_g1_i1:94-453(-)
MAALSAAPCASAMSSARAELAGARLAAGNSSSGSRGARATPAVVAMANPHEGKGVFAPAVSAAKAVIGEKTFNQMRGKAIAVHSQEISEFCSKTGADSKQRQQLIRLAKQNGAKLGFLA